MKNAEPGFGLAINPVTRRARYLPFLCVLFILIGGCVNTRIIRIEDNAEVTLPALAERLSRARLILVGEVHNEIRYHEMQLAVIRALHDAGEDVSLGMEMFNAEDQTALNRWVAGEMTESELISVYRSNWKVPWENYRNILVYARANQIPVIGLNIPNSVVHQVFESGLRSLTPKQMERLPGIKCDVSPAYKELIRKSIGEHEMKGAAFINFCEAQMVWDTSMAWTAVQYLNKHNGRTMVVIAGIGHTWKYGIPKQVKRLSDIPYLVIRPKVFEWFDEENIPVDEADYLIVDRLELFGKDKR